MNIVQEDVLKKLISHYKETGENSFDSTMLTSIENASLKELETMGYISISSDILGNISLTEEVISKISEK